jgi:hypothetical protein
LQPYELWIGNVGDLADIRGPIDAGVRAVVDLALNERPQQLPRDMMYCRFLWSMARAMIPGCWLRR